MNRKRKFNPNEEPQACERYLTRSLDSDVRFIEAVQLPKSTREPAWRVDIQVDGKPRSYVLRLGMDYSEHEFAVLRAMEDIPIPTPRAFGWDPDGEALGVSAFFYEFIEGQPLLGPVLAGEKWAEDLFLDTVCALQGVTIQQLEPVADRLQDGETAKFVLERAYDYLKTKELSLVEDVYQKLNGTMPETPTLRFSNGDLWLENFIVKDRKLMGVIDFANACFSDPLYEFLLPFFVEPKLCQRGIEEEFCDRLGLDPRILDWYRGLEYFDTFYWVILKEEPFVQYTAENLVTYLDAWLKMN